MKKGFCLFFLLVILMLQITVQADYVTFYDVINDIKLLFGTNPDTLWGMSRGTAAETAGSLEGFTCSDAGETLVCRKNHWSGEFTITLYFAEEKPAALQCTFTGSSIQDLNYPPNTAYIYNAEDLGNRLKSYGLVPAEAGQKDGSLYEGMEVSPYGPVYEISENTELQAGYIAKSAENPKFSLTFLAKAISGDFVPPAEPAPADASANASGEGYTPEFEVIPFEALLPAYPVPNKIPAASEEDFYGDWLLLYVSAPSDDIPEGGIPVIMRGDLVMEDFSINQYSIGPGTITENNTRPSGYEFRGGKLYVGDMIFEMNDNGMISASPNNTLTFYMAKAVSEGVLFSRTYGGTKVELGNTVSDSTAAPDASASAAENDTGSITLTVSANEIETGDVLTITVSAPGADAVRLQCKNDWREYTAKEEQGSTITYRTSAAQTGVSTYYAAASYNGVWSDEKSNAETVTYIPASILRFTITQVVHEGDGVELSIYPMKDITEYNIVVKDASGNAVSETTINSESAKLGPFPAGKYTVNVSCSGETEHTASGMFEVSAVEETGKRGKFEETQTSAQTANKTAAIPAKDDPAIANWELKYYTQLIDNQPDMDNVFDVQNMRNSPLAVDSLNIIIMPDGHFAELNRLDNEWSGLSGTWHRNGSDIYLDYPDGTVMGPFYFFNNDMSVKIPGEGNKETHLQFTRSAAITDPDLNSFINALVEGSGFPADSAALQEAQKTGETEANAGTAQVRETPAGGWIYTHGNFYYPDGSSSLYFTAGFTVGIYLDENGEFFRIIKSSSGQIQIDYGKWEIQGDTVRIKLDDYPDGEPLTFTFTGTEMKTTVPNAETGMMNEQIYDPDEVADMDFRFALGYWYITKIGDSEKAFEWFLKAAEQGHPAAQYNIGIMYRDGRGTGQDPEEFVKWLTKAAEQGYSDAEKELARAYYIGIGVESDPAQALNWYKRSAEQGDANAQYNLAVAYAQGWNGVQDHEQAFYWFKQSAEQNDYLGQFGLANAYYNGQGVEKDDAQALYWWTKSAENGYVNSQRNTALAYENGIGTEPDYEQAVYWFTKAAETGDMQSQKFLADCYLNGKGVDQDFEQAFYWYHQAAVQGDAQAQLAIGLLYNMGAGVDRDDEQAKSWIGQAAAQGLESAQEQMNKLYPEE